MISRRPFAALGLLALALAACSPGTPAAPAVTPTVAAKPAAAPTAAQATQAVTAPTTAPPSTATSPATAVQPVRGGTLVIAASADPGQFNPAITTAGGTHFVADSLYNGLIFLDQQRRVAPGAVESNLRIHAREQDKLGIRNLYFGQQGA